MLAVIFIAGTYFCASLKKSQKFEPAKISCHTVSDPQNIIEGGILVGVPIILVRTFGTL